jgi:hypothetical protein
VLHHKSRDTADLVCSKATIGHEHHRLQPELGHVPLTLHVDVRRFPAVRAEENEAIRSITKYGRHRAAFLVPMLLHSEERFYAEKKKVATEAERTLSRVGKRRSKPRTMSLSKSSSARKRSCTFMTDDRAVPATSHGLRLTNSVLHSPDGPYLPERDARSGMHRPQPDARDNT